MESFCFFNGTIVPISQASVNVYDIGLLRGYGVYEGIKIYNNMPFRLQDHLDRFRMSAAQFDLTIPYTDTEICHAIDQLVKRNSFADSQLRIILTGGQTIGGIEFDPAKPTFYILHEETKAMPSEAYSKGAKLITFDHQRTYPEYKTINYITAVKLQKARKAADAVEVLYVSGEKVLECATSNFFLWKGSILVTAPLSGILSGITRKVVLELARTMPGIQIEEREIAVSELAEATEAFITGSFKELVPIVDIDGRMVGNGKVGSNTSRLTELFHKYVAEVSQGSAGGEKNEAVSSPKAGQALVG